MKCTIEIGAGSVVFLLAAGEYFSLEIDVGES